MDTDIQRALRTLGKGFSAQHFNTAELLRALGIDEIYLVSGYFDGVFFSLKDLTDGVEVFETFLNPNDAKIVKEWIACAERKSPLIIACPEAWQWLDWDNRRAGIGGLVITVLKLTTDVNKLVCCDEPPNAQFKANFLVDCENCNGKICLNHILSCQCDKNGCINCFTWNEGMPNPQCPTCYETENCSGDHPDDCIHTSR